MNTSKQKFIEFAVNCGVLSFGQFTLKSGRQSPYFFNAGLFYQGSALCQLGQFYAELLLYHQIEFQHLFGPAYKGFPLATATAIALAEKGKDATVTFNRKEAKDHGEKGQFIGAPLQEKTIIIDDVITAGTAFREAQALIKGQGAELVGIAIALDRGERGQGDKSILSEIEAQGIQVFSIITVFDLIDYLNMNGRKKELTSLLAYLREYGATSV